MSGGKNQGSGWRLEDWSELDRERCRDLHGSFGSLARSSGSLPEPEPSESRPHLHRRAMTSRVSTSRRLFLPPQRLPAHRIGKSPTASHTLLPARRRASLSIPPWTPSRSVARRLLGCAPCCIHPDVSVARYSCRRPTISPAFYVNFPCPARPTCYT